MSRDEILRGIGRALWKRAAWIAAGVAVLYIATLITASGRNQSAAQLKGVKDVITSVKAEEANQERAIKQQTAIINRQFQAICVIVIETSGQQGLQQLDPTTEERCRSVLTKAQRNDQTTTQGNVQPQSPAIRRQRPSSATQPQKTTVNPSGDANGATGGNTTPQPTQNLVEQALGLPDLVINAILGRR